MTQSGQGEELSAQPAREGIVLPSDGGEPLLPGTHATPAGGQAWGGSWGPGRQTPQAGRPDQDWPPAAAQQWTDHGAPAQQPPSGAGPLPPEGAPAPSYGGQQPGYGAQDPYQQHQHQHQQPQYPAPGQAAAPLPPAAPGGYQAPGALPPMAEGATQYLPPVPAAPADEGATQYIPPVTGGALPPQSAGEETRFLGLTDQRPSPDAEATQYIPPYQEPGRAPGQAPGQGQGGDRQPPAEFDNLFRNAPAGADGPAGATAQLPRVEQPGAYPPQYASPQTAYSARPGREDGQDERPRRRPSKVPLIAAVGVGIVVVGVGAGALLSSGGGSDSADDNKTVAATSAAPQSSGPAVDPARAQAVELDKLLADSGSSRAAVIKSVADVKQCASLDQAASSLRDAAGQRGQLVTRLGKLGVDKLPDNAALTDALTKAWQASASADNHYAAWADQVKGGGKRTCHKGHAKVTDEAQAGNRASGTASQQKTKAAALWNAIAQKYGLTQRQPTQL
ncbi:hypothetical protein ACR9VJ_20100 [Streptomyces sp. H49]|uniref:hypothetical protein n=1 Tax=Streptomyces sp. H49 TaxID=3444117 RepID=UPI003F4AD81F